MWTITPCKEFLKMIAAGKIMSWKGFTIEQNVTSISIVKKISPHGVREPILKMQEEERPSARNLIQQSAFSASPPRSKFLQVVVAGLDQVTKLEI